MYGGAPIQDYAGATIVTVLEARDVYGNLVSSNTGVVWNVLINNVVSNAVPSMAATGVWSVTWTPQVAATYTVVATMNGAAVANSGQYQVVISAQTTPFPGNTVVTGDGWKKAHVGEAASFSLMLRDTYSNVILNQLNVTVAIAQGATQAVVAVVFVPASSSYTVTYTCPTAGQYLMTVTEAGLSYGGDVPWPINVEGALTAGAIVGIAL